MGQCKVGLIVKNEKMTIVFSAQSSTIASTLYLLPSSTCGSLNTLSKIFKNFDEKFKSDTEKSVSDFFENKIDGID